MSEQVNTGQQHPQQQNDYQPQYTCDQFMNPYFNPMYPISPQNPQYYYDLKVEYKEYFTTTLQAIKILQNYRDKKWNQTQLAAYNQCLNDISAYINTYILSLQVTDMNVYNNVLEQYGSTVNQLGYQLYLKQLDYMIEKEGGGKPKDKSNQQVKKEYEVKEVEQKEVIRKDDPVFDIEELKSRSWPTGKFVEKDMIWKQNANLIFIGHVDSGKSTLTGNILKELKQVDEQELARNKQEAKQTHMETWQLAFIADTDPNQRKRGKTVQCSKLMLTLQKRRFTLFDAPGHKNYIPNMIMGACQADIGVLLISAKEGQFQSGFEREGQTKQHAMLARALGVQGFIAVVSKMNTVDWDEKRYRMIKEQVEPFLANSCGYQNVPFIPIDSLTNTNIHSRSQISWYKGPCLIQILNGIKIPERTPLGPLRIPIVDKFKDQGLLYVYGKVESGIIEQNQTVSLLPRRDYMNIKQIYNAKDQRMPFALAGENVKLRVKGIEQDDIHRGDIVCNNMNFCQQSCEFKADLTVLELPEKKKLVSSGYECILHMHAVAEQIEIAQVEAKIDLKTKKLSSVTFLKPGETGKVLIKLQNAVCLEKFDFMPGLGRFTLRDQGKTIGFGQVTKIKPAKTLTKEQKEQLQGTQQKTETPSEAKETAKITSKVDNITITQS